MKFLPPKIEFPVRNVDELKHVLERMYNDVYLEVLRHETIAWVEVTTFENSWVNIGSGFSTSAYCKDALGFVHIKGRIANGTLNAAAFTLPIGYRPFSTHGVLVFPSVQFNGSNYVAALTLIDAGNVKPYGSYNSEHQLDGITFYAG